MNAVRSNIILPSDVAANSFNSDNSKKQGKEKRIFTDTKSWFKFVISSRKMIIGSVTAYATDFVQDGERIYLGKINDQLYKLYKINFQHVGHVFGEDIVRYVYDN